MRRVSQEHRQCVRGTKQSFCIRSTSRHLPAVSFYLNISLPHFFSSAFSSCGGGILKLSGVESTPGPTCSQGEAAPSKLRNACVSWRGS